MKKDSKKYQVKQRKPSKTKKRRPENVEGEEGEESKGHKKRRGVNFNTQEERDYRLKDKPKRGTKRS